MPQHDHTASGEGPEVFRNHTSRKTNLIGVILIYVFGVAVGFVLGVVLV